MKFLTSILLCVLFLTGLSPTATAQNTRGIQVRNKASQDSTRLIPYRQQYALLIGIDSYTDQDLPPLDFATKDVDALAEMLVEVYDFDPMNIQILKNEDATRVRILSALQYYMDDDSVDEESQLLFYYAGHGETIRDQIGYILPHDTDLTAIAASGIRMNEIRDVASVLRPKHALFLMDACYGGLATLRAAPRNAAMLRNAISSKARQLITAGSANEQVLESPKYGHSAFMYALIEALGEGTADSDNDHIIRAQELSARLQTDVAYYAQAEGGKQTPQYAKLTPDAGEFLFIRQDAHIDFNNLGAETVVVEDQEAIIRSFNKPVRIRSNVPTARVFVDDKEVGFLDSGLFNTSLRAGFYDLRLALDNYEDAFRQFTVTPQDSLIVVNLQMSSTVSSVLFDVVPPDATVYVDNEFMGAGSFRTDIGRGRRQIEVTKEGYLPHMSTANIVGDSLVIPVVLDPIVASLTIDSLPFGATLIANGTDTLGVTPIRDYTIAYGRYRMELRKTGYETSVFRMEVHRSEEFKRTIDMRETAEVVARRDYRSHVSGGIRNFVVNGALAGGAFYGFTRLTTLVNDTPPDDENLSTYKGGKWAALGVGGALAIGSLASLIRAFSRPYDQFLDEETRRRLQEERIQTSAFITPDGPGLAVRMTF